MKHVLFFSPDDAHSSQVVGALVAFGKRDRFVVVNAERSRPPYVTSVPYVVSSAGRHLQGVDAVTQFVAGLRIDTDPEPATESAGGGDRADIDAFVNQEMLGFSDGYSYLDADPNGLAHQFDFLARPQPAVTAASSAPSMAADRRSGLPSMEDIMAHRDRQLRGV